MGSMKERILMAVDDSPASKQAVEYAADLLDWKSPEIFLHLVHVLPPASEPIEVGEGPHPAAGEERARELLLSLRQRLVDKGVAIEQVDVGVLLLRKDMTLVEGLLDTAFPISAWRRVAGPMDSTS